MRESIPRAGVGDDDRRAKFSDASFPALLDLNFYSDGAITFENDFRDFMIGKEFAAQSANYRACCFRNFAGAAAGIPRAVEVMRGDQRMRCKRALAWRQAVVRPLRRNHGAKLRIAESHFEILPRDAHRQV